MTCCSKFFEQFQAIHIPLGGFLLLRVSLACEALWTWALTALLKKLPLEVRWYTSLGVQEYPGMVR
jgi:hypothetical protein